MMTVMASLTKPFASVGQLSKLGMSANAVLGGQPVAAKRASTILRFATMLVSCLTASVE